ncbi:hypothetical protein BJ912DRAFT_1051910 [Pholiota molesta]|nr:hypothetical protein BJ912DRAFT_1051910 [Pholiota molesta]
MEADSVSALANHLAETDVSNNSVDAEEDIVEADLTSKLITKPKGQPGRPQSGGYTLAAKLTGWRPQLLDAVTNTVKDKADEVLDLSRSYRGQKKKDVQLICGSKTPDP